MNTKQLDAVGDIVGLMLAEALTPIRREMLALKEAVAALPVGPSAEAVTQQINDLAAGIERSVAEVVKAAVDALPAPEPGKSITVEDVRPLVAEVVKAAVDALPAPEPGKSITAEDVRPLVAEVVKAAVDALPAPEPGKSVTVEDVRPLVAEVVKAAVDALPAPKDGVGLAGAMIDRDGVLQITTTAGTVVPLGKVVGTDGKSFDGFSMEYLPETHEVRIKATCAGREQELRFDAGGIRMAKENNGYWSEGVKFKAAEAVSYDGCLWVARAGTTTKPAIESPDWVLAARQGRRGADGKDFNAPRAPETIKVGK